MSKAQKEKSEPKVHKKSQFSVKKDPKTGLFMLSGPSFKKEDIDRSFPKDHEDRVSTVMRRSVGL
ncbi:hypothetical protein [Rhodohalobacter sulfatireducens]|uniref:Uncharacterized protein n=1 Tax=Rhodohalobacter sulfatireducens TaxID=2911366 RepID=A0ABS9KIA5_9BACT|nr:hypothetical protein [Rhodohalobacter sulfatireducens]MCG2590584.1 hypothetical protein [Rhodohalobacter sulfatireducens]